MITKIFIIIRKCTSRLLPKIFHDISVLFGAFNFDRWACVGCHRGRTIIHKFNREFSNLSLQRVLWMILHQGKLMHRLGIILFDLP
jgi:hypothetical protein